MASGGIDQTYSARTPPEVIELFKQGKENARTYVRAQKALAEEAGLGRIDAQHRQYESETTL